MPKGKDAAGIIIIDEMNRVLLVHQNYGKRQWSIPGGMVEVGEAAWEAANRELQEEVNIRTNHKELSGVYFQPHKKRYIYTFKSYQFEGLLEVDHIEIDQFGFFHLEDLPKPISSFTRQRIMDALNSTKTVFRNELLEKYEILS